MRIERVGELAVAAAPSAARLGRPAVGRLLAGHATSLRTPYGVPGIRPRVGAAGFPAMAATCHTPTASMPSKRSSVIPHGVAGIASSDAPRACRSAPMLVRVTFQGRCPTEGTRSITRIERCARAAGGPATSCEFSRDRTSCGAQERAGDTPSRADRRHFAEAGKTTVASSTFSSGPVAPETDLGTGQHRAGQPKG